MRRDLVMMATIAAIVGVGLAAGLTAALGVRSSGPPAPLRTAAAPAKSGPAQVFSARIDRSRPVQAARKRADQPPRRKPRRVRRPAPAFSPPPVVAQTPPVSPEPSPEPAQPQPTQRVSAPAPAPAPPPPKPLSRPKPTNAGGGGGGSPGVSFDDSG